MIPKIIHYCWLSNDPIPDSLQECMDSWKKFLPDYEFIHWDFNKFNKESSIWVKQAFENKKYAFASDYIRLYALFQYGGIYLDMDVEVLKSFNSFLELDTIMCFESYPPETYPEMAAFGAEKGSQWIKDCLNFYNQQEFINSKGEFNCTPLPKVVKKILQKKGYKLNKIRNINEAIKKQGVKQLCLFPSDYFSPKSYRTNEINITKNTVCIHHFAGTWKHKLNYELFEEKFWDFLGCKNLNLLNKIKWFPHNLLEKLQQILGRK